MHVWTSWNWKREIKTWNYQLADSFPQWKRKKKSLLLVQIHRQGKKCFLWLFCTKIRLNLSKHWSQSSINLSTSALHNIHFCITKMLKVCSATCGRAYNKNMTILTLSWILFSSVKNYILYYCSKSGMIHISSSYFWPLIN